MDFNKRSIGFVLFALLLLAGCSGGSLVQSAAIDSAANSSASGQGVVLLGSALLSDKDEHAGITVKLSGHGMEQTTTTDSGGNFSFSSLAPGFGYQVRVS
jgi:hypothetical protein